MEYFMVKKGYITLFIYAIISLHSLGNNLRRNDKFIKSLKITTNIDHY